MTSGLLTREQFKFAVFLRDKQKCVHCGDPGVDAHHILDRKLFPDGGYYLDNGVTLCGACHLAAEHNELSPAQLRWEANIQKVILPPGVPEGVHDKWGRVIRTKYPHTSFLPWSKTISKDPDTVVIDPASWGGEVVITEKMDGENTTMYTDHIHARSIDSVNHWSRERVKATHAELAYNIPAGWRLCGENMTAVHSIEYDNLDAYFLLFSIWDEHNTCLSWESTMEWSALLGIWTVPLIYWGQWDTELCKELCKKLNPKRQEGLVVRPACSFHFDEFPSRVGKYVRANHVQTDEHWLTAPPRYNKLLP